MSVRAIVIGLAVCLALGAAIYLGIEAGSPKIASGPSLPAAGTPVGNKTLKGAPAPLQANQRPAPLPSSTAPKDAPVLDKGQILAALKQLAQLSAGPDKQNKWEELVAQLAALDPQEALAYVDGVTGEEHDRLRDIVFGVWAEADPVAASGYFSEHPPGAAEDRSALAAIAHGWAGKDPKAALAWVATLPDGFRAEATAAVVAIMAEKDPQNALNAVKAIANEQERAEAMQPLAIEWGKSAPVVAAAWVSAIENEAEKNYAASGLVTGWMTSSPRSASEWVSQMTPGNARDSAIIAMVDAPNSMKNPESTLTWAANILDVELRNQVLPQILKRWQAQDPSGAATFISKHSKK